MYQRPVDEAFEVVQKRLNNEGVDSFDTSTSDTIFAALSMMHYCKREWLFNLALFTSVASQCLLHRGNQRICAQVQPFRSC